MLIEIKNNEIKKIKELPTEVLDGVEIYDVESLTTNSSIVEELEDSGFKDDEDNPIMLTIPKIIDNGYIMPDLSGLTDLSIKIRQNALIDNLTVTTSAGNTFDANDTSRANMNEAILASSITGITETNWKLADNTIITVTVDELSEALALGIQAKGLIILD